MKGSIEIIMMNMQNMMRQAQKLQKQMEKSQAELAATEFVGKSAQDLVVATLTGDKKVVSIDFNPAVVDADDIETLSDMTTQAINAALEQIDEATKKKMGAFAGKLPFWSTKNMDFQIHVFLYSSKNPDKSSPPKGLLDRLFCSSNICLPSSNSRNFS